MAIFNSYVSLPEGKLYGYGSIPMKIPFLGEWTSINPSYFDVNRRGTIGFDTLPYMPSIMAHLTLVANMRFQTMGRLCFFQHMFFSNNFRQTYGKNWGIFFWGFDKKLFGMAMDSSQTWLGKPTMAGLMIHPIHLSSHLSSHLLGLRWNLVLMVSSTLQREVKPIPSHFCQVNNPKLFFGDRFHSIFSKAIHNNPFFLTSFGCQEPSNPVFVN